MDIKGVLFDFDGVVVDSIGVHKFAWSQAYKNLFKTNLPNYSTDHLTGKSSLKIAEFLCGKIDRVELASKLAELKLKILLYDSPVPDLLPGSREIFKYLKKLDLPYGIASNAPKAYIEKTVRHHDLDVSMYVGYDEIPNPKPAPDPYLVCAKMCGIKESEFKNVIVFEDSVPGIMSAISAGMIPVGVETTHSCEELEKGGAVKCCKNLLAALNEAWFASELNR